MKPQGKPFWGPLGRMLAGYAVPCAALPFVPNPPARPVMVGEARRVAANDSPFFTGPSAA